MALPETGCKGQIALHFSTMSLLLVRRCATASFLAALAACGGTTFASAGLDGGSKSDSGSGTDGGTSRDTGGGDDSGGKKPDGAADDSGGDDAGKADSGTAPDSGSDDSGGGNSCPSTRPSGTCTDEGESCHYAGAECRCSHGNPPTAMLSWSCTTLAPGCPNLPPMVGSPCGESGLACNYGQCSGGESVICTAGLWTNNFTTCPGG